MVQMGQRVATAWRPRLRDAGLRVTRHRLTVLALLEAARWPMTHAELFEGFERGLVDRTTVFRNLMSLVGAGLVTRADNGDHLWRYSLASTPQPRAHFSCERCGAQTPLPPMTVTFASRRLPAAVASWQCAVQFVGLCKLCN